MSFVVQDPNEDYTPPQGLKITKMSWPLPDPDAPPPKPTAFGGVVKVPLVEGGTNEKGEPIGVTTVYHPKVFRQLTDQEDAMVLAIHAHKASVPAISAQSHWHVYQAALEVYRTCTCPVVRGFLNQEVFRQKMLFEAKTPTTMSSMSLMMRQVDKAYRAGPRRTEVKVPKAKYEPLPKMEGGESFGFL